jgi:hypothetical protein
MLCVDFVIKYNATESLTLLMDIPSYQNSVYGVALENLSTCENRIWYGARKKKQYGISWGM